MSVPGAGRGAGEDPWQDPDHDPFAPLTADAPADSTAVQPQVPSPPAGSDAPTEPLRIVRPGFRRHVLIGALLVAGAVAGLVIAFVLGSTLRDEPAAAPEPVATSSPTVTPTPSTTPSAAPVVAAPTGPATAGQHPWNELAGGECLSPYTSPWELEFTVVDCAAPHSAQLSYRGAFPDASGAAYPGEAGIVSQLGILCSAPTALDLAAAAQYPDLQTQATYPADQAAWDAGDRTYSCFASRTSGEPLTGSLAPAA